MMPIALDRSICCDLNETVSREWLITNGLGAYAAGTVAGMLTRMEQGLLVACPPDTNVPQLLLAKIDEEVVFDQRTYYLGTNEYRDGTLNPSGFVHLETFRLEEGFPVFTYRLGGIDGIVLEKRIWMQQGRNTTYIQYRVIRTTTSDKNGRRRSGITGALSNTPARGDEENEATQQAVTLTLLPFTAYRPFNQPQHGHNDWHFQVHHHQPTHAMAGDAGEPLPAGVAGCTIRAWEDAQPYHLLAVGQPQSETTFIPTNVWYWHFLRRQDAAAGRPALDDLYLPGVVRATLWPDEDTTLTIIVSTEELATQIVRPQQLSHSYRRSVEGQKQLLSGAATPHRYFGEGGEAARAQRLSVLPMTTNTTIPQAEDEAFLRSLLRASERFLSQHKFPRAGARSDHELLFGRTESVPELFSNFYGMKRYTRDTLLALPGIAFATGHFGEIARLLRILAQNIKQGMLPEIVPLPHDKQGEYVYRDADTLLWYCYALDHYVQASQDYELLQELYPQLVEGINWLIQGNEYGVKVDAHDGLLALSGTARTWMNAERNGGTVTPRLGKPVELNALWYNALSLLHAGSQRLTHAHNRTTGTTIPYQELLTRCRTSFQRKFWYDAGGYLFDVIEGPHGNDATLRPNQLFAFSLHYPVLDEVRRASVLDVVTKNLLTPYGLRTLAPNAEGYHGSLGVHLEEQQGALHQGSVWTWLLGAYVDALLCIGNTKSMSSANGSAQSDVQSWRRGLRQLAPFQKHLTEGMLDMVGGVFDGDMPHAAGYHPASVLACAELLRVYHSLTQVHVRQPHLVQSR